MDIGLTLCLLPALSVGTCASEAERTESIVEPAVRTLSVAAGTIS